jgi:hypothetical protein
MCVIEPSEIGGSLAVTLVVVSAWKLWRPSAAAAAIGATVAIMASTVAMPLFGRFGAGCVAGGFALNSPSWWPWAVAVSLIAGGTATAATTVCTYSWVADGVTALCSVLAVVDASDKTLYIAELAVLFVLLGADDGVVPRSKHLTWWGIAMLATVDAAALTPPSVQRSAVESAQAVVSLTIVAGTVVMSALQCDVLVDAAEAMGTPAYIIGNYAIHYYPAARGVVAAICQLSFPGAAAGLSFVCAYVSVVLPAKTYGCPLSEPATILALVGAAILVAVGVMLAAVKHQPRAIKTQGAHASAM